MIDLDEYEMGNLLWALKNIHLGKRHAQHLNTGDWVCQVIFKLEQEGASLEHSNEQL